MTFATLRNVGIRLAIASIMISHMSAARCEDVAVMIDNFTFEPAQLADRVGGLPLEGPAHEAVHRAPVAVSQLVGDLLIGLACRQEPDRARVARGRQGVVSVPA